MIRPNTSTLILIAGIFAGSMPAEAEIASYYIGIDGQEFIPSGTYAGMNNPNYRRLTFLYAHSYADTPSSNHYHSKGRFVYAGPNLGAETAVEISSANYVPEGTIAPIVLSMGRGLYEGMLVSMPYSDHNNPTTPFSRLEIRPVDDLAPYPAGTPEAILYQSSGRRWVTSLAAAEVQLVLVELTPGLAVGTRDSLDIGLNQPGDVYTLGSSFTFTPYFYTHRDAKGGIYTARFQLKDATGTYGDSGIFEYRLEVVPHREELREGHIDLLLLYEESEGLHMALAAGEHNHGGSHQHGDEHIHEHLELDRAKIVAGPRAVQIIPQGQAWAFLGEADRFFYVLPQSSVDGVPFLGLNSEELEASQFASEPVLTLTNVEGPGDFFLYQVDAFGQPVVFMNSADAGPDTYTLPLGTHVHLNWAFSEPGEYKLTFVVNATMTGGIPVTSEPQVLSIHIVGQASFIHHGHADIGLGYEPEHGLHFFIAAEADHQHQEGHSHAHQEGEHHAAEEKHPADTIFLFGGYSLWKVPDLADYSFLGAAGSTIYLSGQQLSEGVPFIGWNTEALDPSVFTGDIILELHEVAGPGTVFLYELDAFGKVTVLWNSADPAEDLLVLPAGLHRHLNLAVTAAGTYELAIHAKAQHITQGEMQAYTTITLQAGGLEGYFGHFKRPYPHWIWAETGGWFYTKAWPWLWSPDQQWVYAAGPGGPHHFYFRWNDNSWLWTAPTVFPHYWSFASHEWMTWSDR